MSHRVNRSELLSHLEAVSPGLSAKDILEQSSCFVFRSGQVMTYNDEVACRAPSGLPEEFTGAVAAAPLLNILRKLPEDDVEIEGKETELIVRGKRRESGIKMEANITLPISGVEKPLKHGWRELPGRFSDAISIVQECAGRDQDDFALTCVHITPDYVEATDSFQIARYKLKTGFAKEFLVRRESIKHVLDLGMTHVNETESWVHFKSPASVILSCRRYSENYPALAEYMKLTNPKPATLPKGLVSAAENANIFSQENADSNNLLLFLEPGRVRIRGEGVSGWYTEWKKLKYAGASMSFLISPKVLIELVTKHNDCLISSDRLMVDGGGWRYVTSLSSPDSMKAAASEEVPGEE